jgi:hypothetical protein
MPTILNSYSSNDPTALGKSIGDLGSVLFGPQALQADLIRKKAIDLDLNNTTRQGLMDKARTGMLDFNDPATRAYLTGAEKPEDILKANRGMIANTYGAMDPRTTNAAVGAGEAYGQTPQGYVLGQNVELRKADMATERAANVERYKADNTPVNVMDPTAPSGYRTVSRSEALRVGAPQVLSNSDAEGKLKIENWNNKNLTPEQQKAAGMLVPQDHLLNWDNIGPDGTIQKGRTVNGKTDVTTGLPLPPTARVVSPGNAGTALGGPTGPDNQQMRDIRGKINANQELIGLTNAIEQRIKADPTIVGAAGNIQGLGQNAIAAARDAAMAVGKGKTADESLANIRSDALTKYGSGIVSLLPEMFKPSINELHTLHTIMVYKTAEALAGQEGRNLSDRDVAAARSAAGDPTAWSASSPQVLAQLQTIRNLANANVQRGMTMLNTQNMTNVPPAALPMQGAVPLSGPAATPAPAPAPQAAPQAPAVAAPAAPQAFPPVQDLNTAPAEVWTRGPDGRPMRVK